jgi:hypothetical protein
MNLAARQVASERMKRMNEARVKHGLSRRGKECVEFRIWKLMIKRCEDPKHKSFKSYGGRGIFVCKRWRESFENFFSDMGPRPHVLLSIERKDNNGPYEKSNCTWADWRTQARNRTSSRRVFFRGATRTIAEVAELAGIRRHLLYERIERGWPIEIAVSAPADKNARPTGARRGRSQL